MSTMSAPRFEDGAQVQLNSGGPIMTVKGYDPMGKVICTWFDDKKRSTQTFAPASLKPYSKRGQPS